ncbi:hypothetical protein ACIBKZ_20630 [Streptomyces sp. NPDC050421]|uniref:hypothetical protein n=1 Tax=Streptomyces sp. NPDC050421 TaxID=3365613 RepID=UPI0037A4C678
MSYGYPPPQPGRPEPESQEPWQYPPQPGPGWGSPMPPPKKTNVGLIVGVGCGGLLLALVIVGAIVALVSSGDDGNDRPESGRPVADAPSVAASASAPATEKATAGPEDAERDVTITACTVDSLTTWAHADVEILNHGSDTATYIIRMEFVDPSGTRLADGLAVTSNLAPGQKAKEKAQGVGETKGKVSCRVTEVMRQPAE